MRILIVTGEWPFGTPPRIGGGGAHAYYLSYALAEQGHHVRVLAYAGACKPHAPTRIRGSVDVIGCNFDPKTSLIPIGSVEVALRLVREWKPDVVHGHHLQGGFISLVVAAAHDLPMILTMHKPPRLAPPSFSASVPPYKRARVYALWRCLVRSPSVKGHVAYSRIYRVENSIVGVPRSRLRLIRHGVPTDFLRRRPSAKATAEKAGIRSEERVVLCPMRPEKAGVDTFIEACELLHEKWNDSRPLRFVVTGGMRSHRQSSRLMVRAFRTLIESQSDVPKDRFVFKSFPLARMWDIYRRSQVCVVPSLREGLSITLLEAMAIGTPVVGAEVSGIDEVIVDGETGLLFSPNDAEDLAEKILRILKDERLARELARHARERVESIFSASTMARKHVALYRRMI